MENGKKSLVLGIGSPLNRDDRAGLLVVESLEKEGISSNCACLYSPGFEMVDKILDHDRVVIVDAASFGHPPGTVTVLDEADLASGFYTNMSHALSINQALELGRMCFAERMPQKIKLVLIEAKDMTPFSDELSQVVEQALEEAACKVRECLLD